MAFTLEELITAVGSSVQAAQYAIDAQAAQLFYTGFTASGPEPDGPRRPLAWDFAIPASSDPSGPVKQVRVPVTALMSHRPLQLDTVDIRIPLSPCERDGQPAYTLSQSEAGAPAGELILHFAQLDTPEGMARVVQNATQIL